MSKNSLKEEKVSINEMDEKERIKVMHELADKYQKETQKKGFLDQRKDKAHLLVSLVKSVLRIAAGTYLMEANVFMSGALLIAAEVLGIIEELVV